MSRGKINPPTSEMVLCGRTGGINVTGKELIFKLIDENADISRGGGKIKLLFLKFNRILILHNKYSIFSFCYYAE